jgi:5-methylcytosine-specific restriction endonuclease McrA
LSGPSNHPAAAHPTWLRPAAVPVWVIAGPPGNGAIDYIAARQQAGEVIICLVQIIAELSGGRPGDWLVPALRERNRRLDQLADAAACAAAGITGAWLIAPSPLQWQRDWWGRQLGADVRLVNPGRDKALARAAADGVPVKYVHQWYAQFNDLAAGLKIPEPRVTHPRPTAAPERQSAHKRGYGRDHRVLRDEQLEREPHCRRCLAEGRGEVPATVLDHIEPFTLPDGSKDFKRWGDPKNHRSLCQPCHDAAGARTNRPEKPLGNGADGRPLDPAHPWNKR